MQLRSYMTSAKSRLSACDRWQGFWQLAKLEDLSPASLFRLFFSCSFLTPSDWTRHHCTAAASIRKYGKKLQVSQVFWLASCHTLVPLCMFCLHPYHRFVDSPEKSLWHEGGSPFKANRCDICGDHGDPVSSGILGLQGPCIMCIPESPSASSTYGWGWVAWWSFVSQGSVVEW